MLHLVIYLVIIGFAVGLLLTYVPMPTPIKQAIVAIVIICMVVYVLNLLGFTDIPIPASGHRN